jgi:hypothetical protein
MANTTLEAFVRRLFGDQEFKSRALRDPESAMANYRLDSAEKAAARKLCLRMVTPEGVMTSSAVSNSFWL